MRKLISIACLAVLGGCAIIVSPNDGDVHVRTAFSSDPAVEGNGISARDERVIGSFQHLRVNGSMVVDVRVGPAPSLVVEADSNLLPFIHTDSSGDTLDIYTDRIRSRNPVHITYTVPRLTELHSNGSGRVTVLGLHGAPLGVHLNGSGAVELAGDVDQFEARLNGSGRLDASRLQSAGAELKVNGSGSMMAGEVRGDHATIGIHGSGQVQARGMVRVLNVRTTGSGNAELEGLTSERADLATSGSGGIYANVRQTLLAQTTGSGPIRVRGNPVERNISGKSVRLVD